MSDADPLRGDTTSAAGDGLVRAQHYAALSPSFEPENAFAAAGVEKGDIDARLTIAAVLSAASDTGQADGRWRLRSGERSRIIAALKMSDTLADAVAWRADQPDYGAPCRDLSDALLDRGNLAEAQLDALVAETANGIVGDAEASTARRAAEALQLAGSAAPGASHLGGLRLAVQAEAASRTSPLLTSGVFGREDAVQRVLSHVHGVWAGKASEVLFVRGIGGIGKSTLLAEVVRRLESEQPIVIHLDFDRPTLDGQDAVGLVLEATRQVSLALGASAAPLREERLRAAGGVSQRLKADRILPPVGLLAEAGRLVRESGRSVIVVLDTIEVLAARGDEHPVNVLTWLTACREAGIAPMAIVAAGRGDVPASIRTQTAEPLDLKGLDDASAGDLLQALNVPEAAWPAILRMAGGNPLTLRLAARLVLDSGEAALAADGLNGDHPAKDIVAAQLYRMILSRIVNPELPELREIAHPGLLVRRLNAELVRDVIAPELGMPAMSLDHAAALIEALKNHAWLVDIADGWVSHRSDIRPVLLPLQVADDPRRARRLNLRAAKWFAGRPESWAPAEALYHRLQAAGETGRLPRIDREAARQLDELMIGELLPRARDAVLLARGERSGFARAAAGPIVRDGASASRAAIEIESLLERGETAEAANVLDRAVDIADVVPLSSEADSILESLWRSGQWDSARTLLRARDRIRPDWQLPSTASQALAQMQLRAEFSPDAVRRWIRHHPEQLPRLSELVAGAAAASMGGPLPWLVLAAGGLAPESVAATCWPLWTDGRASATLAEALRSRLAIASDEERLNPATLASARQLVQAVEPERGVLAELAADEQAILLRLLAVDSGYAKMIVERGHRVDRDGHRPLLDRIAALMPDGLREGQPAGSEPIGGFFAAQRFDNRGRLAEWLGVLALFFPATDNALLARALERRRRTLAGYWSFGTRPAIWLPRSLDQLLERQLELLLLDEEQMENHARERLREWGELLPGTSDPEARLLEKLARPLRGMSPPASGTRRERLFAAAAELAKTGVPAALLPELAVLQAFRSPSKAQGIVFLVPALPPPRYARPRSANGSSRSYFPGRVGMADNKSQEEARGRLSDIMGQWGDVIGEVQRAAEAGQVDPARYRVNVDELDTKLEGVDNPIGLEAIIRAVGRPPMLIRNDKVVFQPVPLLPTLTEARVRAIDRFIPSVGRVEFVNHDMRWGGTGFVVEERPNGVRRVVTNRHVAKIVARRGRNGVGIFNRSPIGPRYGAKLDMREEVDSPPGDTFELPVTSIIYLADDSEADVALLEIQVHDGLEPPALPLAANPARDSELVATIGYPAYDDRNGITEMRDYFGDLFDVKRFAPGYVMTGGTGTILSHDCTTLGGNSGSCLISLDQSAVVGLHFSGEFGIKNAAVGVDTLKNLLKGSLVALSSGMLGAAAVESRPDGQHTAAQLANRAGYDPAFLGEDPSLHVPWPTFGGEIADDLAQPSDALPGREFELRYTHFGVLFSTSRKAPLVTAVNIDGGTAVRVKRGDDKWFFDLRIDRDAQLGQDDFGDAEIDRGHMVRREDPNWGDDAATANDDTFHYTNAALQHSMLNQGKTLWQGLENYILDSSRTKGFKATVFTGPVFREDDLALPPSQVQVPQEFWKIVAMPAASGRLHATAYLLSQGQLIRDLLETRKRTEAAEGFLLGAYRTFQVAIAHIEEATGLSFAALRPFDPLGRTEGGQEALDEGRPAYVVLDSPDDLVLGPAVPNAGERAIAAPAAADRELEAVAAAAGALAGGVATTLDTRNVAIADRPTILLEQLTDLQDAATGDDPARDAAIAELFQRYEAAIASPSLPDLEEAAAPSFATLKPEYERLLASCTINAANKAEVDWYVRKLQTYQPRYDAVGKQLGIPWWFVGITHALEASFNFKGHLHNGDPLAARTTHVPAGRPRVWNPPSDWETSAVDAMTMKGYAGLNDWSIPRALYRFEAYNGWGSRWKGINTPYLWSFSNHYTKGKFIRDRVYDPNAVSKQCGAAVMIKALAL